MRRLAQWGWWAVQRIAPGAASRLRRRRAAGSAGKESSLEKRVAQLEKDLELMAAHIAALTAQLQSGQSASLPADDDVEARLIAARLGAIAFYEERISRLEEGRRPQDHGDRTPNDAP